MLKLIAEEQGVTFHSQMGRHLWIQEGSAQVNIRVSPQFFCTLEESGCWRGSHSLLPYLPYTTISLLCKWSLLITGSQ